MDQKYSKVGGPGIWAAHRGKKVDGPRPARPIAPAAYPLLFSANVEGSNFKFGTQLGFGSSVPRLGSKMAEAGLGSIQKIWDPLFISATAEASNFKFGTQLGYGE